MGDRPANTDIAVIGLSCRFPGASSADEYWRNLCAARESVTFFSDDELLDAGADPALIRNPNYVKAAPILPDVETFDAAFFGYSPKDAALMDPQQRIFLEVCWEAFEDAGYDPPSYPGRVGVISTGGGVVTSYLLAKLYHADLPGQTASISHINNDKDFLSTRVSFKLNLTGPSFTVQSACSSSLLAVHYACQNIRFGECDAMLVGGSVVRVPQIEGYLAEKRNLHSLDGHCRPFDAEGQGTIFGSGVGAVLIKPLERALADRDHIYAVIKGTAANNDGSAKSSYTAPSLGPQAQAVADALAIAGVDADSIGYLECHSTGTIVGDPLEIEALSMAFRRQTSRNQYCAVGSVKANIGHPEQAAGIAGLIKTSLILHHGKIPPSINYETPNPEIDFEASPFFVNDKLSAFSRSETPRRAGLNSLGIGGTNVFAVLEEAPEPAERPDLEDELSPKVVTLSAKSPEALVARVEQLSRWLDDNLDVDLGDLCYTTNVSRSKFAYRFAAAGTSIAELKGSLDTWLRTTRGDPAALQRTAPGPAAFLFSGQGTQSPGMTAGLYRTYPHFKEALDRCGALARPHLERDLLDVIFVKDGHEGLIDRTDYTQPALFAVEYALAELLGSWGIVPGAVIGHSLGEFTAACVAGVIGLDDAMRLVCVRGALTRGCGSGGAMAAVIADEGVTRRIVDAVAPDLSLAAMNGPLSTVVSGTRESLDLLKTELDRQEISYRDLRISNGFHSPLVDPVLHEFEAAASEIAYHAPNLPFVSNLTGEPMTAAPTPEYWRAHLREGVRFADGMRSLAKLGCGTYLEVGPHPVLLPMAQACLGADARSAAWAVTLNRQEPDAVATSTMLSELYSAGHDLDWAAVHAPFSRRRIPLPTYPFRRKRHWIDGRHGQKTVTRRGPEPAHPLLGESIQSHGGEMRFEASYGVRRTAYLSDHRVSGTIVLPTAAELETATVAGRRYFATSEIVFCDAMHHRAMIFEDGEDLTVQVRLRALGPEAASFELVSKADGPSQDWRTHMTGTLRRSARPSWPAFSARRIMAGSDGTLSAAELYDRLGEIGLEYGPSFRGVRELHYREDETLSRVTLPPDVSASEYLMHPGFLDACLHVYPVTIDQAKPPRRNGHDRYLPISVERFSCFQEGIGDAWVHSRLRHVADDGSRVVDIRIYDSEERPAAEISGLAVRRLSLADLVPVTDAGPPPLYCMEWRRSPRAPSATGSDTTAASWIVFADSGSGVGAALAEKLGAMGHHCHLVHRGDALENPAPRQWVVNERRPDDVRQLFERIERSDSLPPGGVVYLWGLDAPAADNLTLAELGDGCEAIGRAALAIMHAVDGSRSAGIRGRRLWFVTSDAQQLAGADRVEPVQATLWGLGRTAALEYPGLWGGLIDLRRGGDPARPIEMLAEELIAPDGEGQIAIADGRRYVARFARPSLEALPSRTASVRSDATYLVTGGLGMLGRSVARWLLGQGARHLVLAGRNAGAARIDDLFSPSERAAADIRLVSADVSKEADVRRVVQSIADDMPPLKGVVHSAGVLDDGILAQLDWSRFQPLFEPRVYGGWLLHKATESLELDFFILKSSLLSLLGSAGQGNYTASSAFLDALAAYRRACGLPATVINWCAWSEGGLATVSGARGEAMWSSLGVEFISPDTAMRIFDDLMTREIGQVAVAVADWPTYAGKTGNPPLLAELVDGNAGTGAVEQPAGSVVSARPEPSGQDDRSRVLDALHQRVADELGFTDAIDPDAPLNDVGLDSLMSVALSNSLEQQFGVQVPVAVLIGGPSINQIYETFFRNISWAPPEADSVASGPDRDLAETRTEAQPVQHSVVIASLDAEASRESAIPLAAARETAELAQTGHPHHGAISMQERHGVAFPDASASSWAGDNWPAQDSDWRTDRTNGRAGPAPAMPQGEGHEDRQCNATTAAGLEPRSQPRQDGSGVRLLEIENKPARPTSGPGRGAAGRWLIAPRPNPDARARLFCFPYAGGGLVSFRSWPELIDPSIEVVAVEPPGRGTRINEPAVATLDAFVENLIPEIKTWLDRPAAFFGHCLGGLTMFVTLCALRGADHARFLKHAFACGIRAPNMLAHKGAFEENLLYELLLHPDYDLRLPLFSQSDDIFSELICHFDTPAAEKMLSIPKLRDLLLPTVRAEFAMAHDYQYRPVEPFSFPLTSFVGSLDPWVGAEDSAGWGRFTRAGFKNHVREGSHFLMAEDREYIIEIINDEILAAIS